GQAAPVAGPADGRDGDPARGPGRRAAHPGPGRVHAREPRLPPLPVRRRGAPLLRRAVRRPRGGTPGPGRPAARPGRAGRPRGGRGRETGVGRQGGRPEGWPAAGGGARGRLREGGRGMNLPTALRTVRWMVRDTFRQSLATKLFWVMLAVTAVCTLVCLSVDVT